MATDYSPEELAYLKEKQEQQAAAVAQSAPQPVAKPAATNTIPAQQAAPTTEAAVGGVSQPVAAAPNYGQMVGDVTNAYKGLKQQAPSVLESLDTSMPWLKYIPALIAGGYVANKALGQEKPSGIKSRSIVKTEPQMDVSVRQPDGRIEPTLDVVEQNLGEKPTIPTAEQATKEMVESGKLKGGKAYGSTDVLDQAILKSEPFIEVEKKLEAAGAVKGAAVPSRRTPKEAVVFKEETPFNKAYNQYSQKLGGMNAPTESPLQKQFDTAWEDIHKNVLKGEMPKSQGGNPVGWDEAEKLVRSQPEKYPDIIKHLDQAAEKYGKSYTSEKGFASLSGMANLAGNALGALGLTQAYKQAKKTGDWSDFGIGAINQVVGNIAPRAAVPLALMTPSAVSSGTLDSPEARELFARAQAKQVGAGRGIAPPSAYMR